MQHSSLSASDLLLWVCEHILHTVTAHRHRSHIGHTIHQTPNLRRVLVLDTYLRSLRLSRFSSFFSFSSLQYSLHSPPLPLRVSFISHSIAKYTHVHTHFISSHIRKFLKGVTGGLDSPAIDIKRGAIQRQVHTQGTAQVDRWDRWLITDEITPQLRTTDFMVLRAVSSLLCAKQ